MPEQTDADRRRDVHPSGENGATADGATSAGQGGEVELPGDVTRKIETGEAPDPMWYVGRVGPSVQDILDADEDELTRFHSRLHEPPANGNGAGEVVTRRARRPRS